MEIISSEEVLQLWKKTNRPTGVYIHSAFCKEQCSYCVFKGTIFNKHKWRQYYDQYLPNMLKFYNDTLSSLDINGYYFGGGTPSLMTPDEMSNIFDLIPNFKSQKNKLMEMHVVDWNKEQLNLLKEYNFNIVTVCVQTFDRDALKKSKRRVPKDTDIVCEHIRYANSIGLNTNSDLMYLETGDTGADISRLIDDMQILADNKISEMSISTIFDISAGSEAKYDNITTAAVELFLDKNPEYALYSHFRGPNVGINIPINYKLPGDEFARCLVLRMFRKDKDVHELYHWLPQLEEMDKFKKPLNPDYNTLGIGSYDNHKYTFSTIEDKIEYVEIGDLVHPKFYVLYDNSKYTTKDMIADFYDDIQEHVGDPPNGVTFSFSTQISAKDVFVSTKEVRRELLIGIEKTNSETFAIREWEDKLGKAWPILEQKWIFI